LLFGPSDFWKSEGGRKDIALIFIKTLHFPRVVAFVVGLDRLTAPRQCSRRKTEAGPAFFLYVDSTDEPKLVRTIQRGKRIYNRIRRYVCSKGGKEGRRREGRGRGSK
jgi:hypothetical protein